MASAANLFYLTMLVKLNKNYSFNSVLIISVAVFLGNYLPQFLIDKTSKDKIFIFEILPPSIEEGKIFSDNLRENNIATITHKSYKNKQKTLMIKAYSHSKEGSVLIEKLIPKNFKYHIIELRNFNN